MSWRNGRARINARAPRARATCDRCGWIYNLQDLKYQYQWAGVQLQNLHIKVCTRCLDVPQEQLRTIVLPADPLPVDDPRIEQYTLEVNSFLQSQEGPSLLTESGQAIIWEINVTPDPDPNQGGVLIP